MTLGKTCMFLAGMIAGLILYTLMIHDPIGGGNTFIGFLFSGGGAVAGGVIYDHMFQPCERPQSGDDEPEP